jgi:glycosyltransferase involved in cell wall biosynthesis
MRDQSQAGDRPNAEWTVIVPFHNERAVLPATLRSLTAQTAPARIVLVDNGSTDGSGDVAREWCRSVGSGWSLIFEPRPGKVFALAAGLAAVLTPYVATCDADTFYPPDYLDQAAALLRIAGAAAALAWFADADVTGLPRAWRRLRVLLPARALPRQCHSGGAGQAFRTEALRAAGGFDPGRWNLVLEDHEVMHRLTRLGALGYGRDFWCAPSPRPRRRQSTRWTLAERLLYHVTPGPLRDRYFYRFLARRLAARGLSSDRLREDPCG